MSDAQSSTDQTWPVGTLVHVISGTHAGKHGDVLSFDAGSQRLYVFVKGFGAISVPTAFCKREGN